MVALSYISNITVTRTTSALVGSTFGVTAFGCYHTAFASRYRDYTSDAAVATDFTDASHPVRVASSTFFGTSGHPPKLRILRFANVPTRTYRVTPTAANTKAYKVKVNGTEVTYTSDGTATVAEITAGLTSAINGLAISGVTATDGTTYVQVAGTAGTWFTIELTSTRDDGQMTIECQTADPGMAADLTACLAESKSFNGLVIAELSKACITATAAWVESNKKLFAPSTLDTAVLNNTAGNTALTLKTSAYDRSITAFYASNASSSFPSIAMFANFFAATPGSRVAYYRPLNGLTAQNITDTEQGNLDANNVHYVAEIGGVNRSFGGKVASGEWIDVIYGIDYYADRELVRFGQILLNSTNKVDYTDAGISLFESAMRATFEEALANKFARLDTTTYGDFGYKVVVPALSSVATNDIATRTLTGLQLEFKLAGAVKYTSAQLNVTL